MIDEPDPPPPDTVTHLVVDGVVIGSVVKPLAQSQADYPNALCLDAAAYPGGIGWTWDGSVLTEPVE